MFKREYEQPCLIHVNDMIYGVGCDHGSANCSCEGCTNGSSPRLANLPWYCQSGFGVCLEKK
jgi:hypothetical protein